MAAEDQQHAASDRVASYGRGGAGNIGKEDPTSQITPQDLVTPTLKAEHYTTGRGGSGNMAKNDPLRPDLARAAQDVDAPNPREQERAHHYGRGGAANIAKTEEEKRKSGEEKREEGKGLVDMGKEVLRKLGGGKK